MARLHHADCDATTTKPLHSTALWPAQIFSARRQTERAATAHSPIGTAMTDATAAPEDGYAGTVRRLGGILVAEVQKR